MHTFTATQSNQSLMYNSYCRQQH